MGPQNVALVVGATGVTGFPLIEHLLQSGHWKVYGVARNAPQLPAHPHFRHVAIDLAERTSAIAGIAALEDVTHVFYGPNHPESATRRAMLETVLDGIETPASKVANVHVTQGMKYYGVHLGRHSTPVRETDARIPGSDFYYAEEDLLLDRQRRARWTWTALRPHSVCAWSPHNRVTLASAIAVYASMLKRLGRPLEFPASPACFEHLWQMTDGALLARAAEWISTNRQCANQAFNVSNGDSYRWCDLWPRFAAELGLAPGGPAGYDLADFFERERTTWHAIASEARLSAFPYDRLPGWVRGDYRPPNSRLASEYDVISDVQKLRRSGFHETIDDAVAFISLFRKLRQERVIPN